MRENAANLMVQVEHMDGLARDHTPLPPYNENEIKHAIFYKSFVVNNESMAKDRFFLQFAKEELANLKS